MVEEIGGIKFDIKMSFLPISRGPAIGFGRKKRSAFEDDNTKDEEDLLAVFDSQKKNRLIFS